MVRGAKATREYPWKARTQALRPDLFVVREDFAVQTGKNDRQLDLHA